MNYRDLLQHTRLHVLKQGTPSLCYRYCVNVCFAGKDNSSLSGNKGTNALSVVCCLNELCGIELDETQNYHRDWYQLEMLYLGVVL